VRRRLRLLGPASSSLLAQSLDDIEVYADFYRAHYESILAFLARRVFDPEVAFDLMSETFAKALERRRQFRGSTAQEEQAWLFAIARTELLHYWRSGKIERAAIQRFSITIPRLSDQEFDRIESFSGLTQVGAAAAQALCTLPADQRAAVELRVLKERSYAEVASELSISEPTARARVSRGLRALARELSDVDVQDLVGDTA
jgi:RNA polymerase sigma factor (sigma-70 family)